MLLTEDRRRSTRVNCALRTGVETRISRRCHGLVYGVEVEGNAVNVIMTLTAPGCQMGSMIRENIEDKLLGLPDCERANVEIVWDPPWKPHMMSEAARKKLDLEK